MKLDWIFLRIVAITYTVIALIAVSIRSSFVATEIFEAFVVGGVLSLVNLLLGYICIELGFERPNTAFLKIVLGGMVGRLFLMWAAFLILVEVFGLHQASFVYALLGFYVVNLILEISFLQRKASLKS